MRFSGRIKGKWSGILKGNLKRREIAKSDR